MCYWVMRLQSLDKTNSVGMSALHMAAAGGHLEVIKVTFAVMLYITL